MKIGVLASQGAFVEHISILHRLEVEAIPVRLPQELQGSDGLIIPGGESTTIRRLMLDYNLAPEIDALAKDGMPVFGTCAGLILLAKKVIGLDELSLGLMDIEVKRNAFGRQVDSFETDLEIPALGDGLFHAVFIRAPLIEKANPGVEILARLPEGTTVAVRQGNLIGCAFHPELVNQLSQPLLHDVYVLKKDFGISFSAVNALPSFSNLLVYGYFGKFFSGVR